MKVLIFGDIHGNRYAMDALLCQAETLQPDKVIFLGDIIGYFYNPQEVIKSMQKIPNLIYIRGNHDQMFLESHEDREKRRVLAKKYGSSYLLDFSKKEVEFLSSSLPFLEMNLEGKQLFFCHGTPADIYNGRYYPDAKEDLFILKPYDAFFLANTHYRLFRKQGNSLIINPGSSGLPRDGKGFSFILLDTDSMEWTSHNLDFDVRALHKEVEDYEDFSENNKAYLLRRLGEYL